MSLPARERELFAPVDADIAAAGSRAAKLAALARHVRVCELCPLSRSRRHAVPGEGSALARLMIVGEGPGASEDDTGRPFAGRSGAQLDRMLAEAGILRRSTFITNIVKCRAADEAGGRWHNRSPWAAEVKACRPYLARQIAILRPRVILCLGAQAGRSIIGPGFGIGSGRGRWFAGPSQSDVIATYHPAYIQRGGPGVSGKRLERLARADLESVSRRLKARKTT